MKTKLTSRKFWLGVVLVVIGVVLWISGDKQNAVTLIAIGGGGYLGVEGVADIASRIVNSQVDSDEEK